MSLFKDIEDDIKEEELETSVLSNDIEREDLLEIIGYDRGDINMFFNRDICDGFGDY